MRRSSMSNRMRWAVTTALSLGVSLAAAGSAQAVVVDMNQVGQVSVPYNSSSQAGYYGVALVPENGTVGGVNTLWPGAWVGELQAPAQPIPAVTSSAPCTDPALAPDLWVTVSQPDVLPNGALCSHGGAVMHNNEVFDLSWDPVRRDWATTRNYVEQFLRDAADGSGTLSSPYADTSQYTDGSGHALNSSKYGGGCIDYGSAGGSCAFGDTTASASGYDYPQSSSCTTASSQWGTNQFYEYPMGAFGDHANEWCVTDADIQGELQTMISQTGLIGRTQPGYTPLVTVMTPPGVEVCLDSAGELCSANGASPAKFCSYHGQVNVGGTEVAYAVLPWVTSWGTTTGCDDPGLPQIPSTEPQDKLAIDVGKRLVSPLSQAELAAITNPAFNGWFGLNGSEINDNGCVPFANDLDKVTVGNSAQNPYYLQREGNNGGVIEQDPNALACTGTVLLVPQFVVPSAVNQGDVVELDGSKTMSTLLVPKANYHWDFGDGSTGTGPSVVHAYTKGGSYNITLTVTDRGLNTQRLSQTIQVLGANGQPVAPPSGGAGGSGPGGSGSSGPALNVHLQLLPQSLRSVLSSGIQVQVSSNRAADGIARVSITRSVARRAHIKTGSAPSVQIGIGTVRLGGGVGHLRLYLSRGTAAKLRRLGHVTLTIRMQLVAANGTHLALDAAGRY